MSKTRKILSVVLALVMVFSLATVAFAVDFEETQDNTQTWTLGNAVANGSDWDVPVTLVTNYATGAVQFELALTGDLAVKSVAIGAGYPYTADINVSKTTNKVVIVPETYGLTGVETASEAKAINGVIATVTLTGTTGTVTIKNDPKTATKPEGTLIALRLDEANIVTGNLIAGQKVTADPNTVTIGAADPELVVIDGTNGVIDITHNDLAEEGDALLAGYVYGVEVPDGEAISDVFEVVGDGYMNIVANDAGSDCGTGVIVQVCKNSDDSVVAEYAFILFGDVDGTGEIDGTDAGIMELHDAWDTRIENPCFLFAGDVDGTTEIDGTDAGLAELHDAWDTRLVQADVAVLVKPAD